MEFKSTRDGFGEAILELAEKDPRIVVVTADLRSSTRVEEFARRFPKRFFEVGVAEQNLIGIAGGLAMSGKIVFVTSFACFSPAINWAQIKQTVCYNCLNVKIVGSHSGLATGADGATHQALEDVALTTVLPRMTVIAPADYEQAKTATEALAKIDGPAYLRLTRPATIDLNRLKFEKEENFVLGIPQRLKSGRKLTLAGFGPILPELLVKISRRKLAEMEIFNCHTLKPFDGRPILASIKKTGKLIVVEDHQKIGGLGALLGYQMARAGIKAKFIHLGVEDQFGCSARNFRSLWKKYIFDSLEELL
jgi:transketolase